MLLHALLLVALNSFIGALVSHMRERLNLELVIGYCHLKRFEKFQMVNNGGWICTIILKMLATFPWPYSALFYNKQSKFASTTSRSKM